MHQVGLIFDMDGVIIDSMPIHFRAYCGALSEVGINDLTEDEFYLNVGEKGTQLIERIAKARNLSVDPESVYKNKNEIYGKNIQEAELNEGIFTLLRLFKSFEGKTALASASSRKSVEAVLGLHELHVYFDAVVTGEDVEYGKPDPAIFLKAAELIGIKPEHCIVFEDAINGVEAARRAGMKVIKVSCC